MIAARPTRSLPLPHSNGDRRTDPARPPGRGPGHGSPHVFAGPAGADRRPDPGAHQGLTADWSAEDGEVGQLGVAGSASCPPPPPRTGRRPGSVARSRLGAGWSGRPSCRSGRPSTARRAAAAPRPAVQVSRTVVTVNTSPRSTTIRPVGPGRHDVRRVAVDRGRRRVSCPPAAARSGTSCGRGPGRRSG